MVCLSLEHISKTGPLNSMLKAVVGATAAKTHFVPKATHSITLPAMAGLSQIVATLYL